VILTPPICHCHCKQATDDAGETHLGYTKIKAGKKWSVDDALIWTSCGFFFQRVREHFEGMPAFFSNLAGEARPSGRTVREDASGEVSAIVDAVFEIIDIFGFTGPPRTLDQVPEPHCVRPSRSGCRAGSTARTRGASKLSVRQHREREGRGKG
jgi:hypothetical protein